ncbi:MFS transporter [Candidatus Daviesbacteria bacterium]|nr:MFS transporter [Candidatus Daviesbacteria bacterium]
MQTSSSYASVLKNPGFLNLWVNQILVQFAYNSLNFALILWVFRITNSNTAVAALLASVYLPSLLFGIISGVLVDVIDRKKIIILIDLILSGLFISLMFFKTSYISILFLTFLINSLVQLYLPAESSALPLTVKKEQLFVANSLFSTTFFSTFLIGFGLSGPLITLFGINFIFKLGAGVMFLAFLLALKFPSITSKEDASSIKLRAAMFGGNINSFFEIVSLEIRQTINMIRKNLPIVSALFILAGVQTVIGAIAVLLPSFLEKVLQIRPTDISYIVVIPLGIGMVLGAILIGRIGHGIPRRTLVARSILFAGSMLFLVGIAPLISPAIQHFPRPRAVSFLHQPSLATIMTLGSLLLGISVVSVIIPSQTVLQENTPEQDRGKVFGVLLAIVSGLSLLPILFAGILSDLFGTMPIFIAIGGFIAIFGLLILKPDFFFEERHLPFRIREFLGLGHWKKN